MTAKYGFVHQLGIDTANPVTKRFNCHSDTLGVDQEIVNASGLTGTRSSSSERSRSGPRRITGSVVMQPNPTELNLLLAWILGGAAQVGTPSGKTTFPLADTLSTRYVTSDRGAKVPTFSSVGVDKATFTSTQGAPLELKLDLVATDETVGNSGTFPALAFDLTQTPFMHEDLVLTIDSNTYSCPTFELEIDNMIDKDRFFNSATLTAVVAKGRVITLKTRLPYGDASATYNLATAGVAAEAKFTSSALSLDFVMPALGVTRKSATVEGPDEIFIPIEAVARRIGLTAGTTDELSVILDLT